MTKLLKSALMGAVMVAVVVSPAWADRYEHHGRGYGHHAQGRSHNALGWGMGLLAGTAVILAATRQPLAYYSPVVVETPVYVQQAVMAPRVVVSAPAYAPPQNHWYYCAQAGSYYPYVQSCPTGWLKVLPN